MAILTDLAGKARFIGCFLKIFSKLNNQVKIFLLFLFVSWSNFSFSQEVNEELTKSSISVDLDLTKPLTIAINRTSAPYHLVNNGKVEGIMPDLWRLWAKKQNVKIKFVVLPWNETLSSVSKGEVDIHAGLSITDSRQDTFTFSSPNFPIYMHFYVHQKLHDVNSIDDLSPYAIGVVNGSAQPEMIAKNFSWLQQKPYKNRYTLYNAALEGEILIFTGMEKISETYPNYTRLISMFPAYKSIRYQQSDYGVAVAKGNNKLMACIEDGFAKIPLNKKMEIERKWLGIEKKKNSLLIAFDANYAPYMSISPLGKPQGLLLDIWRLWSKNTGVNIEFVAREASNNIDLVQQEKVDVLLAYPNSGESPDNTRFIKPIYQSKMQVYLAKTPTSSSEQIPQIKSLIEFSERFPKKVIGAWHYLPFKKELSDQFPDLNIRYFNSVNKMLEAIEDDEISAMIGLDDIINNRLIQSNLQGFFYRVDAPNLTLNLSPLVHVNNIRLASIIDKGFAKLDIKDLVAIEKRWLHGGEHFYQRQAKKVKLTPKEQQFLDEKKTINFGLLKNYLPVESKDDEGEFVGINRDILNLIIERTDVNFNYFFYDSWQQVYHALIDNEIDMLASITPTEQREKEVFFSQSYWKMPWVILHEQKSGKQLTLEDFHGKNLAIVKGNYLISKLRERYPLINFTLVDNRQEAVIAIQQDIVEGFVNTMASSTQLLKEDYLAPLMISVIEDATVNMNMSHFGINKKFPLLKDIINKGLLSISEHETQTIYDKWFTVSINTGLNKKMVMQVAAQIGVIILFVLIVIVMWNRRLRVEIKRREQLEQIMKHMATHDELTGLANRVLLKDRLNSAVAFHQRQSLKIAVLFIDLDGFKNVNDSFGHDVGDELLKEVAVRLQGCVRQSDTVVRFGGDEFVLLLTGLHGNNEASFVAEKVLRLMQTEFKLSSINAHIGCSIGIAVYPEDGENDNDLLKVADTLMYKVKAAGKNHYMFNSQ
jgi:diguanylate cyclase (GGDEF)-like protein